MSYARQFQKAYESLACAVLDEEESDLSIWDLAQQCLEEEGFHLEQLRGRYERLPGLKLTWDDLALAPHADIVAAFEDAWTTSLERKVFKRNS